MKTQTARDINILKDRIHGYYYDGETQWVMYEDEDGYIEMREMEEDKDEQSD